MEPIKEVGLCALYCQQGEWALDYALSLARRNQATLCVLHVLESPYTFHRDLVFVDDERKETAWVTPELLTQKEKELRLRYDMRLSDYHDVGCRLCEGNPEWELKKGFRRGEYDVLAMGYPEKGADFGGTTTIEKFALGFHGPLVLVGPDHPHSFYVNKKAEEILYQLNIPKDRWRPIEDPTRVVTPIAGAYRPVPSREREASKATEVSNGVLKPAQFPGCLRLA